MSLKEPVPAANGFSETITLAVLRQIADVIEKLFAPYCEVVIHDFSDLEHSIIHLSGNLSDRSIGGAATDLLLTRVRAGLAEADLHNYMTELPNGRVMKSSTTFLRNPDGTPYGAFCINYDIPGFLGFQKILDRFTAIENHAAVSETLSDDIQQTIGSIINRTIAECGISGPILSREDKINLVARLEDKGIFQVKKAAPILADQFGFSRATIYNYLREARQGKDRKRAQKDEGGDDE
jgi:predicted transcriptional regulator YheO